MRKRYTILALFAAVFVLAGCGGGDDKPFGGPPAGGGGETSPLVLRIGHGVGTSFVDGVLDVAVPSLSAGGSTSITATIVDDSGTLYTEAAEIHFASACIADNRASITSPASTITGSVTTNYVATGCAGDDEITATTRVNNQTLTARGTVDVQPAALGAVQFVSATPQVIALKGTGGAGLQETSTVIFKVVDETGGLIRDASVEFSLDTAVGGLSLTPSEGVSDANGQVQTIVQSGSVATPVRVTARVVGTTVSTQSDMLSVGTGIPDQDSFSLSASALAPEALDIDGEKVTVTAHLSDRYNNPVPDGTAVSFITEGGTIQPSCQTVNGFCSVTWTSTNPRPDRDVSQVDGLTTPRAGVAPLGQPYSGRATILAYAIGEESFIDRNGNGVFDDGDHFTDLPEAWIDDNENDIRDADEFFIDFNRNNSYDSGDGHFNGVLCKHSSLCSPTSTINVSANLVLVMSGSEAYATISDPLEIESKDDGAGNVTPGRAKRTVYISDIHHQRMPTDTTFAVTATRGEVVWPTGPVVPADSNANRAYSLEVEVEGEGAPGDGNLIITVTTPSGRETHLFFDLTETVVP